MEKYTYVTLRQKPQLKETAAEWFHSKWQVPKKAYLESMDAYLDTLDREAEGNNYSLIALYITDIIKNGSYVLFNRKAKDIMDNAYDKDMSEGEYLQDCVSRKKNVVPVIMASFEK